MRLWSDNTKSLKQLWPGEDLGEGQVGPVEIWQDYLAPKSQQHCGTFNEFGPPVSLAFWDDVVVVGNAHHSQFDALREFPEGDATQMSKMACLALEGQSFHGQRNRSWMALAGNLHLSVRVPVNLSAKDFSAPLVMLPAVAVMDFLRAHGAALPGLGIKWVNDVLIKDRKLAGVLTASRNTSGTITSVVFGIGLNVKIAPTISSDGFVSGTTSLVDHLGKNTPCLGHILNGLLQEIGRRIEQLQELGAQAIYSNYCDHSLILGRKVEIRPDSLGFDEKNDSPQSGGHISGTVQAINPDLSLKLAGRQELVTSGRLALIPS